MSRKKNGPMHAQTFRFPADVWQALSRSAIANVRSVNGELIWILREYFSRERSDVKRIYNEYSDGKMGE